MTLRGVGAALAVLVTLAGCYRPEPPAAIDETVRLDFVGNDGRFVRAQAYLADALGKTLVTRDGWRVSPTGTARLQISLKQEQIRVNDRTRDRIPVAQRVRLRGTALLTTRQGSITTTFSGEGIISIAADANGAITFDEAAALHDAAQACATEISEWLGVRAAELSPPTPKLSPP